MPVTNEPPTARQLEVMRLIARGITVRRDIARELGIGSTNGVQDHLERLRDRGLVEWPPLRSAAVRLTSAGWRVLGPCDHVKAAIARGDMFATRGPGYYVGGDSMNTLIEVGRVLLPPAPGSAIGEPLVFCPWCGWRLW